MTTPMCNEVWRIRFDPAEGDEIKKTRTAVVVSVNGVGRLRLKIVIDGAWWLLLMGLRSILNNCSRQLVMKKLLPRCWISLSALMIRAG